jgi:hypothetical protein
MAVSTLEQYEIDELIKKYDSISVTPDVARNSKTSYEKESTEKPLIRCYQQTYPIQYANDKVLKYYGLETIYEQYDPKTNQWYFLYKTGKMIEIRN